MTPVIAPTEEFVLVQSLVPDSRGPKSDCQNLTRTVWACYGDIQPYPKRLVNKLVVDHPTVWRLVDPDAEAKALAEAAEAAAQAAQHALLMAQQAQQRAEQARVAGDVTRRGMAQRLEDAERERVEAEAAEEARLAEEAKKTQAERDAAAGLGTDLVQTTALPTIFTEPMLDAMPDEDIRGESVKRGYNLHPRLGSKNLRIEFLACQAAATPPAEATS